MNPDNAIAALSKLMALASDPPLPPDPPSAIYGGGGNDMEARVAKLEAHMEHVRADLGALKDVPTQLATLTERVSHLPAKGFILTAAVATIAGVVSLLGLLQHLGILR